jgi:hypothetical protein
LFALILGDASWLEHPWAGAGGDVASESWEAIIVVDDVSSITAFVDLLP